LRLLLVTGAGGAGTTTVAAATALRAAREGTKTLLLAPSPPVDPAAGPAGPLAVDVRQGAHEPVEVEPGLALLQADRHAVTARAWAGLEAPLRAALAALGTDPLDEAEFAVPPGAGDVVALLALRDATAAGWDLVVADAGPFEAALALAALPAALTRLLERALPLERRMLWAMGHGAAPGLPVPGRGAVEAVERLHAELDAVAGLLTGPATSARLVVTAEPGSPARAERARTGLALAGVAVDGLVVNRLVPAGEDPWLAARSAAQRQVLADVARAFAPLPVAALGEHARPVLGTAALEDLASGLGALTDVPAPAPPAPVVERDGDAYALVLALPGARPGDLGLARRGDELLLDVSGVRRAVLLPSGLRRCEVTGAVLRDGSLRVAFRPDPALWRSA
jgi:arsenite/tail-anchored protein-transporting ATPase